MKILIAGDWHSDIHEEPVARALTHLGHAVVRFPWHTYFDTQERKRNKLQMISRQFQRKYMLGPIFRRMNEDLTQLVAYERPEAVLVYRGTHVASRTLERIRTASQQPLLIGYNNDDPFSPRYPSWVWRHFRRGLPEYDLVLAYRHHNLEDFRRAGARQVRLWRSWFVPELNHPCEFTEDDRARFECEVVFVGHYEADHRIALLEAVARQGHHLRVFGPDFPETLNASHLRHLLPIHPVRGEDYNKALCGAKVALCFLSKLNRDTYTRRNFEIPATKTMMLSEYTDDLATLFREDVEAAFFHTSEELTQKLAFFLGNDEARKSVATEGHRRVWADGHHVEARVIQLLEWIGEARESKW